MIVAISVLHSFLTSSLRSFSTSTSLMSMASPELPSVECDSASRHRIRFMRSRTLQFFKDSYYVSLEHLISWLVCRSVSLHATLFRWVLLSYSMIVLLGFSPKVNELQIIVDCCYLWSTVHKWENILDRWLDQHITFFSVHIHTYRRIQVTYWFRPPFIVPISATCLLQDLRCLSILFDGKEWGRRQLELCTVQWSREPDHEPMCRFRLSPSLRSIGSV